MSYGNLIKAREIAEETVLDKIGKHYLQGTIDQMPENLKKIKERWDEVYNCFDTGRFIQYKGSETRVPFKHRDLIKHLVSKFEISESQAAVDIRDAKQFHMLGISRDEKEYSRGWLIEQAERFMFLAADKGDFKSVAAIMKNLIVMQGFHQDEIELPDYSKVQPPEILIVEDPRKINSSLPEVKTSIEALIKKYSQMSKTHIIDKMIGDAEDAEEISDAE